MMIIFILLVLILGLYITSLPEFEVGDDFQRGHCLLEVKGTLDDFERNHNASA